MRVHTHSLQYRNIKTMNALEISVKRIQKCELNLKHNLILRESERKSANGWARIRKLSKITVGNGLSFASLSGFTKCIRKLNYRTLNTIDTLRRDNIRKR